MLWNTIKLECKKAIYNKFLFLAVGMGIAITFLSLIPMLESYATDMSNHQSYSEAFGFRNPLMPMETLFNHWIGGESHTPGSADYFFLFPLLVSIPYGWSYCAEKRSGYVKHMVIRSGRMRFYFSKYIALFLSGGLAMVIPLLFNFLLTAMFVPAVMPDPSYITAYGIGPGSFLSMIFYSHPFVYVFLYLLIDFLFGGLIACLSFAASDFVKNRVVVTLLPFFILLGFNYLCHSFVYTSATEIYTELSPMFFLRPAPSSYDTAFSVVFIWGMVLLAVTFLTTVVRGRRYEIY